MTPESISTLVGTVGFPIVGFVLLYRMANETIRENTKALRELRQEINEWRTTRVTNRPAPRMGPGQDDD